MPIFTLYILYSPSHTRTYVGQTENLQRRIKEHNQGKVRSTKAYVPWEMIWSEEFMSRDDALKSEKYYKSSAGRQKIKNILDTEKSQVRSPRSADKAT